MVKIERYEAFIRDLAEWGLRFDTNPTLGPVEGYHAKMGPGGRPYEDYIKEMDRSIRERAREVLRDE